MCSKCLLAVRVAMLSVKGSAHRAFHLERSGGPASASFVPGKTKQVLFLLAEAAEVGLVVAPRQIGLVAGSEAG
jgi:hypothetical protein